MDEIETAEPEAEIELDVEEPALEAGEGEGEGEGEDEFVIEIYGEEDPADLPSHLRKEIRERDRRLAAYEQAYGSVVNDPGPRPTYGDGSQWNYDEEVCDAAIDKWVEEKSKFDRQKDSVEQRQAVAERENQARQTNYFTKMAVIPLPQEKKDAAQATVISVLSELQQATIVRYAKDPAKMVVALGLNPTRLEALAAEGDIGTFILKMAEMERNMKVKVGKRLPEPESETIQRGSAPVARVTTNKAEDAALAKGEIGKFRELRRARLGVDA